MVKLTTCYFCDYGSYYGNKDETTSYPIYEIPEAWRYIKFASLVNFRIGKTPGYLFLNKFNEPITARGVAQQLKNYADKYKMNPKVIYPHSFRHLFAKNFLAKYNDIALLADLMGHESIETTRIYLRKTATEQQNIVDKIVNW
ncbi:integrase/recombinase, phage integrase family [Streptococcus pneumoniae]|nr:integrase/recombinase, phage integrase family [Streptococcus pneumoniae]